MTSHLSVDMVHWLRRLATRSTICRVCNLSLPKRNFLKGKRTCVSCNNEGLSAEDGSILMQTRICNISFDSKHYRQCYRCQRIMPNANFPHSYISDKGVYHRKNTCKCCYSRSQKQLSQLKKEKKYSMHEYIGKQCPICRNTMTRKGGRRVCLDHDHITGKWRGVICNTCNTAIGKLGDDIDLVERAWRYLRRANEQNVNN